MLDNGQYFISRFINILREPEHDYHEWFRVSYQNKEKDHIEYRNHPPLGFHVLSNSCPVEDSGKSTLINRGKESFYERSKLLEENKTYLQELQS